jgi:serine/threonine protein kinase
VATDIYALGVTMFRAFTGTYPYGNLDATSPPRQERPRDLGTVRPDLPAWVQAALARAVALDPAERFADMAEFAHDFEAGPSYAPPAVRRPLTLYERSPVRFWQGVSALLAVALAVSLWWR